MVAAKPDCTGQRFGMLVVLGKGSRVLYKKSNRKQTYHYLWLLQCDCGKRIELARGDFDRKIGRAQVSCGCKRRQGLVDNKRRPHNIAGLKFGTLTAVKLTGLHRDSKPTWLMQCSCGNTCTFSLSRLRRNEHEGIRTNCGDRSQHPDKWLTYPPTPNPYSKEAGELLVKYLPLTELDYQQIDSAVEDEKRDRLIRAAWIITYRREQGEHISELHEKRIINKHLRYCSIDVFWQRKLESQGGFLYDVSSKKKEIGVTMTNLTSNDYPVIETQGISIMPIRKLRFKRC